jgi:hypothetical protein
LARAPWDNGSVRRAIAAILSRILESESRVVSLDFIGETIGIEAITAAEIEELFRAIEGKGRTIGTLTPNVREHLGLVLREARQLKSEKRETPDIAAIAKATGLSPGEVHAALLFASVLSR